MVNDPNDLPTAPKPAKHGFFQKLNPMGLFHHKADSQQVPTPLPKLGPTPIDTSGTGLVSTDSGAVSKSTPAPARPVPIPRYPYLSPARPASGNHAAAEKLLAQGAAAHRDHRLADAIALYRSAIQADPANFDAQSSLGLAAFDLGELSESLRAYELALAINPDSFNARFNFGLALKKAGYIRDAAQELERLLAANPIRESPAHQAMVHLTLANLYAEQFHQTAPARAHYLKVLELDPHNAQATSIRYWLQDNG
ncbi:MAG: hypothetical protein JWQ04_884 [Pedosphaera sp.]|nr:hypothetical protein [Pedosphaera sp.]